MSFFESAGVISKGRVILDGGYNNMGNIWKGHLDKVVPYKPGKPIEEVKREFGLKKIIKLASNESPFPPSPEVLKAIKSSASRVNRYPDGGCYYLRTALAKKLGVGGENIVFGNGSDEIIILALHALVGPGDEVVVADPTFQIYHIASMVKGAKLKIVPCKDYRYDIEKMAKAITSRTKAVFIANPDNPSGTYVDREALGSFLKKVPENVMVFLDEAYYEFASGGTYPETMGYIRSGRKNVIVARTFSKAYSLAGLRVGYGIAQKDIAEVLNKVREPFNVNLVAQEAALAALGDEAYMKRSVKAIKSEMKRFYRFFDSMGISYVESRTNFILVNVRRDSTALFGDLIKRGIIIRDMASWGLPGHIRVNAGLKEENDLFFNVFADIMSNRKK